MFQTFKRIILINYFNFKEVIETNPYTISVIVLSALVCGFVTGISNQPAAGLIISAISAFLVPIFTNFLSTKDKNDSNTAFVRQLYIKQISITIIIFLGILLPSYFWGNNLRYNCNNILGSRGLVAKHCQDTWASNNGSVAAQIRCDRIGDNPDNHASCQEYLLSKDSHKSLQEAVTNQSLLSNSQLINLFKISKKNMKKQSFNFNSFTFKKQGLRFGSDSEFMWSVTQTSP